MQEHTHESTGRAKSTMHEDVPSWEDTCSCEPEPRWADLADQQANETPRRTRPEDTAKMTAFPPAETAMFHHTVHFWLRDDLTDPQRQQFIEGAKALSQSPNVSSVRVGVPAGTPREVVDNSYDYQLHCTFADQAAHDAYQSDADEAHAHFINTFKTFWTKVLIYDSVEV
jgi:hypothetical protein